MIQYISQEAYEALKKELTELKTTKRKEITQRLHEAKELGDLSENSAYQEAKEAQNALELRIAKLEELLKNVNIISHKTSYGVVEIGSQITVGVGPNFKDKKVFTLTGSHEANPLEGKISNVSPLGQAFLHRKKGEIVEVQTPRGVVKYKILDIV
ncbi:MAG: Transcription elongation factor GreA [Parcubacteria group bacterium ADurb.Bin305]|nr:MAG: Transcription elongation factor GreA [Parcubacteria group bacterium ADurb.Bin305]